MLGFWSLPGLLGLLGFAYLAVCCVFGRALRDRLLPPAEKLYAGVAGIRADGPFSEPFVPAVPAWVFDVPASLVLGGIVLTSAVYLLAYGFDAVLPTPSAIHPLLPANLVGVAGALLAVRALRRGRAQLGLETVGHGRLGGALASRIADFRRGWEAFAATPYFALSVVAFAAIGAFIMGYVFFVRDGVLHSGVTAFSDFSPHTAMIRSFSHGRNFPTQYPHFAEDGIRYHFLFLFLTGNLEFLGMRIDVAFNLLGTLGVVAFCSLLGALGVQLTGRRGVFLLAPLLLFLRSSSTFVEFLGGLAGRAAGNPAKFFSLLFAQSDWIKPAATGTNFDEWGIWSYNVIGNQRHLLWGGAAMLIVLFLFLPLLRRMADSFVALRAARRAAALGIGPRDDQMTLDELFHAASAGDEGGSEPDSGEARTSAAPRTPPAAVEYLRVLLFTRDAWVPDKAALPGFALAAGLLFLLPYWHGSVLIATLGILFVLALFSSGRLAHLGVALAALAGSYLQTAFFAGVGTSVVSPEFYFGFVAGDRSLGGVLDYCFKAFGLAFVLLVLLFFYLRRSQVVALLAFTAPFVIAFTVSFLPEGLRGATYYYILVNHKYVLLTFALANAFIAGLLCDLWAARPLPGAAGPSVLPAAGAPADPADETPRSVARPVARAFQRVLAVLLGAALMATGVLDTIVYVNRNRASVGIDLESPLVLWIEAHTSPDAVFLTPPGYAYEPFFLSGRLSYYGHSYFAASAGHDTSVRFAEVRALFAGCDGDVVEFRKRVAADGLSFAIVDDTVRAETDLALNEAFFERYCPVAATFPELNGAVVYDLRTDPFAPS